MSAMDPPLQERVYLGLKNDYLAGHFVPGKRIDIQDLATRYRSSKTPVREAAFILVGRGFSRTMRTADSSCRSGNRPN
jgi:DNA-binding GntR family transcriptional regulator